MHHVLKHYSDVLYIKIIDKFDIDICLTFLNFQTSPSSNCLADAITPQMLPALCHNLI